MKMARKVLSVILAVVMALSCFAVAASAWGLESAERQVKVSLGLSKGSVEWGKDSKGKVTVETDDPADAEIVDGTNIYAEPGDIVWVYVTLETNYYVWSFGNQVFFSGALIDADTDMKNSGVSTANMTTAVEPLIHQWNADNEFVASYGLILATQAPWGKMSSTNKKDYKKAWPTDDNLNVVSGFGTGTTPDQTAWHWTRNAITITGTSDSGLISDGSTWLYRFPLRVPEAKEGTVYTITIPEGMIKRGAKSTSVMYCSEMGDEGTVDGTNELKAVWSHPTDENSGEQYWDLSAATVTITVGEEPSEEEIDYTALETLYNDVKDTDLTNATVGKADFETALAAAKDIIDNKNAESQKTVDDAKTDLDTAYKALKFAADYSALDAAIALAGTKTQKDYTSASWSAMTAKLADANAVARDLTSDDQATIDNAATALDAAIKALVPATGANYTKLDNAIALAGTKVEKNYTADSWAAMQAALTAANNVARDLTSEQQGVIDTATNNLNNAIGALVDADADYTALSDAKTAAAAKTAGKTSADYTAESWTAYEKALNAANAVATGLKAKDQDIINTAAANLEAATKALVELGGANYTALDAAIAEAPEYPQNYYTPESWAAYQTALDNAKAVARDLKSTQQYIVDAAKTALENAIGGLVLVDADYSAVETAKARVDLSDDAVLATYTEASLKKFADACDAVVYGKTIDEQAAVDAMAAAINAVVLEYKAANTKPLEDAIAYANGINAANYTADSYAALVAAKEAGEALLKGDLDIRDNAAIQAAADAIMAVKLVALGADYTALDKAIADFEALTEANYTADSFAAAKAAYDAAKAIPAGQDVTAQDSIDKAAADLNAAIKALDEADADYTAVNTALAKIPTKTTQVYKDLTFQIYTADSLAAVNAAKDAVVTGLKAKDQDQVDAMAAAIEAAVTGLEYADFDYANTSDVIIAEMEAKTESDYTPATWAAVQTAINNIVPNLKMDKYSTAMLNYTKLVNAYNKLTKAAPADYTAVNDALKEAEALKAEDYTAETWAVLDAAVKAVETGKNENFQAEVNAMAKAINDAIDGLEKYVAPVEIDYTALEALYNEVKDTDLTSAIAGKAEFEAALATAKDLLDAKDAADQATVDNAKAALEAAVAGLKYAADYSALNAAIAEAEALNADDYTAASYADVAAAVAAGKAVPADLTTDDQKTIDDAAAAITNAIAALEKKADYTALNDAIAAAEAITDSDKYTAQSWAKLADALAAGKAVDPALGEKSQKTIDDAEAAITNAIAGLKEATPEDQLGHVKNVDYTPAKGNTNTYDVKIEGRPMMVQFYEVEAGTTNSYDRYDTNNVKITSYDADGNVVDSYNVRKIAYEIWTITTPLNEGEVIVRAKANGETKWESLDNNLYTFTNERVAPDASLVSVDAPTSGKLGGFNTQVTVGPDAQRVQFKFANGTTETSSKFTENADGTLTFTIRGWADVVGENVITIRVYSDAGWTEVGSITYTATK